MTITICCSAAFYEQAMSVYDDLQAKGFEVVVPATAHRMRASKDYEVSHYKTWFADANDYDKKAELMRAHFDEVDKADAILILNYEKNGKPNYIGGNVLMEMTLAFHANKPIYVVNEIPEESAYIEELRGMKPIELRGDLSLIVASASAA